MGHTEQLLGIIAAIVTLGIGAQWLAWRMRIPGILVLLTFGCLFGGVLGWIKPDEVFGDMVQPLVSLAVGFILFEGGMTLKFSELRAVWRSVLGLLTVGVLVTWGLGTLAACYLLGLPINVSLVLAAVLTVTGPTVIGPLLREIRPIGSVGMVANWEGIVVDPVGATLAVLVFQAARAIQEHPFESVTISALSGLGMTALAGAVIGAAAGWLLVEGLRRYWIPDFLRNPVAVMFVMLAFVLAEMVHHEAGLVSVTVMGVWLANQRHIDIHRILEFKETLTILLISVLFVFLSARIDLNEVYGLGWNGLAFAAAMILIVRPAAVWLSTLGSKLPWKERAFLSWFAPRGIVAAAVSSVFALRMGGEGSLIAPATFIVIISTVAVYGLTAGRLARYLGLAVENPQGTLIVGANPVARAIAAALKKAGFDSLLIDTRYHYASEARDAGLRVQYANVLSDYVIDELDLGGIGRFLALTANDQVNALAATRFRELFGAENVFQLASTPVSSERFSPDAAYRHSGRPLFSDSLDYSALESLLRSGAIIKATKLTDEFSYADLQSRVSDLRPLFLVHNDRLQVVVDASELSPKANQTVIYLTAGEPGTPELG